MHEIAYELAELGVKVFPVNVKNPGTPEKEVHPLVKAFAENCSNDPAQIDQWVAKLGKRITDWGVPTGDVNDFIAIDLDSKDAEECWENKWFPEGAISHTPRGGKHWYYDTSEYEGEPIQNNIGKYNNIHPDIDVRAEGGFIVAYDVTALNPKVMPKLPQVVANILPKRKAREVAPVAEGQLDPVALEPIEDGVELRAGHEVVAIVTEPEARVIQGFIDELDALPRPWFEGAGYHDTQFRVACAMNRIANSPHYRVDREAMRRLFVAHAPLRDADDAILRDRRWEEGVKVTLGEEFEDPGTTPRLLDSEEVLDKYSTGTIDRLYWEGRTVGDVKQLISEMREGGATEQEAYSVSYDSAAMKSIRARGSKGASTWGFVLSIYNRQNDADLPPIEMTEAEPVTETHRKSKVDKGELPRFLTEEEEAMVDRYPSYVSRYIMAVKDILPEPNMPLAWVNAWVSLSIIVGDRGEVMLEKGRVPLALWGLILADSAAGKGDQKAIMKSQIGVARRGGLANVNAGGNASAEALQSFVSERPGRVTWFNRDESSELLMAMHKENSYEAKMMNYSLDLYDGEATPLLRINGPKDEEAMESVKTTFIMWLQTTWLGGINALEPSDVETGFVGRYLVAVGDDVKITRESLTPKFASQEQIDNGGVNPFLRSIANGMNSVIGGATMQADAITAESDEVIERYVDMRIAALEHIKGHHMESGLTRVLLRVTDNVMKAAALLAVSEGRKTFSMGDMLTAIRSGQYWVRDAVRLVDAISTTEYRNRINKLVDYCIAAPRTRGQIFKYFKDLTNREVHEVLERAEGEGSVTRDKDTGKYVANI